MTMVIDDTNIRSFKLKMLQTLQISEGTAGR